MAKSIDETKLERIKQATIEMVVTKGYGGASVSSIAKRAQVADGYLYRHFPSKQALVQSLYASHIDEFRQLVYEMMNTYNTLEEILFNFINAIFELTNENPSKAMFINMLMNDYTFLMSKDMRLRIPESFEKLLDKGKETKEVDAGISIEEFTAVFPAIPIEYASSRVKRIFSDEKLTSDDAHKVTTLCVKALKG
ncbi:TetR/AcrR family transcriptional regulator [Limibacter armeniacum]|uniref:TetR/AcrR family transcriptional regulator n=1 Tax=Limibacter armeniacum TaxID=466084 RepID=UPI002FE5BE47